MKNGQEFVLLLIKTLAMRTCCAERILILRISMLGIVWIPDVWIPRFPDFHTDGQAGSADSLAMLWPTHSNLVLVFVFFVFLAHAVGGDSWVN